MLSKVSFSPRMKKDFENLNNYHRLKNIGKNMGNLFRQFEYSYWQIIKCMCYAHKIGLFFIKKGHNCLFEDTLKVFFIQNRMRGKV